ncbi:hypothetical protein SCLCIDRAFT_683959 [Scleroderma citrinum Foug A]|uniref:Uncharacterized protein n=1 Tax=Scleroderma citrinum Foug A TaxID=1036808 RepID=A0A0C3D4V9_9AGAM|nr:hypothetical protein SCLCIDRAFT_683959 [Scleroderma citrinum Foug A]
MNSVPKSCSTLTVAIIDSGAFTVCPHRETLQHRTAPLYIVLSTTILVYTCSCRCITQRPLRWRTCQWVSRLSPYSAGRSESRTRTERR